CSSAIEFHTRAGDICYEPFSRSRTQPIAAERWKLECSAPKPRGSVPHVERLEQERRPLQSPRLRAYFGPSQTLDAGVLIGAGRDRPGESGEKQMSYHGHPVIDMDSHIREYWDFDRTYKEYIDPQYREKFAQLSAAVKANQRRPGDTGVDLLWSFAPRRPLGVPQGWEAPTTNGDGTRVRGATQAGRAIDPACSWDSSV